jgi:acyl-coenzyme A thioesterase PaaI-like protein
VARPRAGHPGRAPKVMDEPSLQQRYAPGSSCFGCGPANVRGMRIGSHEGSHGELIAEWQPEPHHAAFTNVLNGGVIGTLLDCHANWAAAMYLMHERTLDGPPGCVTAEYAIKLRRPTPTDQPVYLRAWVVEAAGDRVTVDAQLLSGGKITATARGVFVAVGADHPAYERW